MRVADGNDLLMSNGPSPPWGSDRDEIAQWAILWSCQIAGEEKNKMMLAHHLTYFNCQLMTVNCQRCHIKIQKPCFRAAFCFATYTSSLSAGAKGTQEISEQEILQVTKLVAYPNPTSGIITIKSSFTEEETYTIDLINASGQVILNQIINVIGGKFEIDISDVRDGVYLLRIMTRRTVQFISVIKQ